MTEEDDRDLIVQWVDGTVSIQRKGMDHARVYKGVGFQSRSRIRNLLLKRDATHETWVSSMAVVPGIYFWFHMEAE